jgi:hypothetical protein
LKKLILGLVVGMLLGSSTVAFAATNETVSAVFADFILKINGKEQKLDSQILVYNGTSYLPVRDVANLVGYDVTYKADSRTIELNQVTRNQPQTQQTQQPSTPAKAPGPDLTGWIDLNSIADKYNVNISVGTETTFTKGETTISFKTPSGRENQDEISDVVVGSNHLKVRMVNAKMYISIDDLKTLGFIN